MEQRLRTLNKFSLENETKLRNYVKEQFDSFEDDNGRINIDFQDEEGNHKILKVSYNKEGLKRNYIEIRKYFDLCYEVEKNTDNISTLPIFNYIRGLKVYYNNDFQKVYSLFDIKLRNSSDGRNALINNYKIIVVDNPNLDQSLDDKFSWINEKPHYYYLLMNLVKTLSSRAYIENLTLDNLDIYTNGIMIKSCEGLLPKIDKKTKLQICDKCEIGYLQFDIEHFLNSKKFKDIEAKNICTNILCDNESLDKKSIESIYKNYKNYSADFISHWEKISEINPHEVENKELIFDLNKIRFKKRVLDLKGTTVKTSGHSHVIKYKNLYGEVEYEEYDENYECIY